MASQNIARLGVVLGIDTAEFTAGIEKAISEQKKLKSSITRESNAAAKEIVALKYATEDFGKSLTKVEQIQREITAGKFMNASKQLKDELLKQAQAYDMAAASAKKLREEQLKSALSKGGLTAQQQAALGYQTTDIITSLVSGQNPLLILVQQGGQLRDQFGGITNVFKAFATVITPMRLALGGLAGALGLLAYGFYKGSEEATKFRDALLLTNNYAGITYNNFLRLSEVLASKEYGVNAKLSDTKDILNGLVSSGRYTSQSLMPVAEVLTRIAKLSGESGEEVFKRLGTSFDGTANSAKQLNETFNFLNVEQYKYIEQLEKQGKRQEAAAYTANLLNDSLKNQTRELGTLEKVLGSIGRGWSNFWDAVYDVGRPDTPEKQLKKLADLIELYSPFAKMGGYKKELAEAESAYLKMAEEIANKNKQLNEKAEADALKKQKLDEYIRAGGISRTLDLEFEAKKQAIEKEAQLRMQGANEFKRIDAEAWKEKELAKLDIEKRFRDVGYGLAAQERQALAAKLLAIDEKAEQKKLEVSRLRQREIEQRQIADENSVQKEKEKLELYKQNIFLSDTDYQIALDRLRTEQEIAKIMNDERLSPETKEALVDKERRIQNQREEVVKLGESLKVLRDINQAVFQNMTDALTNFILTGKLNFRNFAQTVITEILRIQAASIAAQASRGIMGAIGSVVGNMFGGMGTAFTYGTNIGSQQTSMLAAQDAGLRAGGGDILGGQPVIVGDAGPELFIPRNAGTIVPNSQVAGAMNSGNVVNNYYIDAIDTKSFEDRILGSSNTVWAANQYANKTLAVGRGRT